MAGRQSAARLGRLVSGNGRMIRRERWVTRRKRRMSRRERGMSRWERVGRSDGRMGRRQRGAPLGGERRRGRARRRGSTPVAAQHAHQLDEPVNGFAGQVSEGRHRAAPALQGLANAFVVDAPLPGGIRQIGRTQRSALGTIPSADDAVARHAVLLPGGHHHRGGAVLPLSRRFDRHWLRMNTRALRRFGRGTVVVVDAPVAHLRAVTPRRRKRHRKRHDGPRRQNPSRQSPRRKASIARTSATRHGRGG